MLRLGSGVGSNPNDVYALARNPDTEYPGVGVLNCGARALLVCMHEYVGQARRWLKRPLGTKKNVLDGKMN